MATPRQRRCRLAEYTLIFFGLAGGYAVVHPPGTPLVPLLVLAPAAWLHLRGRALPGRRTPLRSPVLRAELHRLLTLWAAAAAVTVAVLAVAAPARLFHLPREQPVRWAILIVVYPLVSVYPQELIFRGFLLHRYAPVFGDGRRAAAASAAAFGFAHLIYGNAWSVLLTAVGGWVFARRYQRTGSVKVVVLEHALYGMVAFTVGLDHLFYDDG